MTNFRFICLRVAGENKVVSEEVFSCFKGTGVSCIVFCPVAVEFRGTFGRFREWGSGMY